MLFVKYPNMYKWAHVAFKIDHRKASVPITFIKSYEDTEIEIGQDYFVFRSWNPTETPDSILQKRGKIPHIEKMKRIPTAGWYLATILLTADSEESLKANLEKRKNETSPVQHIEHESESFIDDEAMKCEVSDSRKDLFLEEDADMSPVKRRRIEESTDDNDEYMSKAILEFQSLKYKTAKLEKRNESLIQIIIESNNKVLELENSYGKTKEKLEAENKKTNDLERLNENLIQTINEKNNKILELKEFHESCNDQCGDSIKNRQLEDLMRKNEYLMKTLSELNAKIVELEVNDRSLAVLSAHNEIELEKRNESLVRTLSESNRKISDLENMYKLANEELEIENNKLKNLNFKLQDSLCNVLSRFSSNNISLCENPREDLSSTDDGSAKETNTLSTFLPHITRSRKSKKSLCLNVISELDKSDEESFKLSTKHIQEIMKGVKQGCYGDSMFVKKLSVALYGKDVLTTSSVHGLRCNAKKDSVARQALCPKKLAYINELFYQRITDEGNVSENEISKRMSKINVYISEKIITLMRPPKAKNPV